MKFIPVNWDGSTSVSDAVLLQAMRKLFTKNPDLLFFVFDTMESKLRRMPEILIRETRRFSCIDRLMVRIALDLWNQSAGVALYEVIERLDPGNFENAITAMRMLGPKPPSLCRPQCAPGRCASPEWSKTLF